MDKLAVGDGEMPLCCDFIVLQSSHNDMVMKDYTGDRLSPQDAETLIGALQESVVSETVRFHSGGGYQNLMVMRSGPLPGRLEPPQELVGEGIRKFIPQDRPYRELVHLMNEAQIILHNHPLNRRRLAENQDAVNSVWFWGNGEPRELPPFEHRFGRSASVVTAAPLLRGMAVAAGMDAPRVAGATGFADTDYGMKLETAWRELETHDVVYLHLSGGEPVSLQGMIDDKIMVIEDFDEKIVGPLLREAERRGDLHLLVTEAQMTSVDRMKYEDNPVPFVVHTPQGAAGGQDRFDEDLVDGAGGRYASGPDLIEAFLKEAV
ncbi:MAG: phosphoglycerate mutase [Nitrospinaceae bacterium]